MPTRLKEKLAEGLSAPVKGFQGGTRLFTGQDGRSVKIPLVIVILIMGFSGLVAQLLLLRELLIVFSGNEFSIGIIFANWVILEAFGSFFLGKRIKDHHNPLGILVVLTIIFLLSLPVAVGLIRSTKVLLGIAVGEGVGFITVLVASFLSLLPTAVAHGALFPAACVTWAWFVGSRGSPVGMVYVHETIGTVLGGVVWTWVFIPVFHSLQTVLIVGLLNLCGLVFLLGFYLGGKWVRVVATLTGLTLFGIGYLFLAPLTDRLHRWLIAVQWPGLNVVHYQNSRYGNITVVENEGQFVFFADGTPELLIPIPDIGTVERFVHLPLFAHPDPRRILILSGGAGGVINEVLKHPTVVQVDYVELDPLILRLLRRFSTPLTDYELTHPRVKVRHLDGRLFLKMSENRYDVILVGIDNPADLQTNRLFTREFFSLARSRLGADGILVIRLPGSLTYLNDELKDLNSSIYHTLKRVFSNIRVFPDEGNNLFLVSNSAEVVKFDRTQLINRLQERGMVAEVFVARHIDVAIHPGWQRWFGDLVADGSRKVNQDFRPIGVFYSIGYWNSLFAPYLTRIFRLLERLNFWLIGIPVALIILLFLPFPRKKRFNFSLAVSWVVMSTGFAGMCLDLFLIFAFQAIYGYVFSWIGLLVTAFMVGAAIGAMLTSWLLPRIRNRPGVLLKTELAIIAFFLVFLLLLGVIPPHIDKPVEFWLLQLLFLAAAFVGGGLTASQFPLANSLYQQKRGLTETAGVLYSADLFGGWLSGMISGTLLLPLLGLWGGGMFVVLIKLSSAIIIYLVLKDVNQNR